MVEEMSSRTPLGPKTGTRCWSTITRSPCWSAANWAMIFSWVSALSTSSVLIWGWMRLARATQASMIARRSGEVQSLLSRREVGRAAGDGAAPAPPAGVPLPVAFAPQALRSPAPRAAGAPRSTRARVTRPVSVISLSSSPSFGRVPLRRMYHRST